MIQLSPNLFDLRYDDLVELGRSRLSALAPQWTDYNIHDPGITLMELLAWVAEAQLYSLGRMRRDERTAYGALLGVSAAGARAARGMLWADRSDPESPFNTFKDALVIDPDAPVRLVDDKELVFHAAYKTLWAPGRIVGLWSRAADGTVRNHAAINERGGAAFLPFGEAASPRDILTLEFEAHADDWVFPSSRQEASGAYWTIGVRADDESVSVDAPGTEKVHEQNWLTATLTAGVNRFRLPIVDDSSCGMMRTGVLMLDMSQVQGSPKRFDIEFRVPQGLPRPARVLRIEPNVLPITQRTNVQGELHVATGQPELSFELATPGLCFESGEPPIRVEISNGRALEPWTRCPRLSDRGPSDNVYEFDEAAGRLLFGNGVNGRKPAAGTQVLVSYQVSDGESGNIARNRKWSVAGIAGVFGVNPDPITGGSDRLDWTGLRRDSRRRAREDHALVSSADIETAAKSLPLLEVARAWVKPPPQGAPRTGAVTLIAMRRRPGGVEPTQSPETPRWLEAVRRGLLGRMLIGTRLVVLAPRYVDFAVRVQLQTERGRDPAQVETKVREVLMNKLALLPLDVTAKPREPGVPVTARDVTSWIRGVDGLSDVIKLEFVMGPTVVNDIAVPSSGLPRLDLNQTTIRTERAGARRAL